MLSIDQCPRETRSKECEDQEGDVGAIADRDRFVVRPMEVYSERYLRSTLAFYVGDAEKHQLTRLPITAPRLKIAQNQEMYRPLVFSGGYDIIIAPCADQRMPAQHPSKKPAKTM